MRDSCDGEWQTAERYYHPVAAQAHAFATHACVSPTLTVSNLVNSFLVTRQQEANSVCRGHLLRKVVRTWCVLLNEVSRRHQEVRLPVGVLIVPEDVVFSNIPLWSYRVVADPLCHGRVLYVTQ